MAIIAQASRHLKKNARPKKKAVVAATCPDGNPYASSTSTFGSADEASNPWNTERFWIRLSTASGLG